MLQSTLSDLARALLLGSLLGGVLLGAAADAAPVAGTSHDLSTGTTPEVCVFCHTPHAANSAAAVPLWNRAVTEVTFTMYSSPTLDATISGQPRGRSMACLSCHDNVSTTSLVGAYTLSTKHDLVNAPGSGGVPDTSSYPNCQNCHGAMYGTPDPFPIGADLGNDHPISIFYPTPAQDPAFQTPPDPLNGWGPGDVRLYDGWIECATCHEPHDPANGAFLRKSNAGSALCTTCHVK